MLLRLYTETVGTPLLDFFRTLTGDENFSRIAEIFRSNLTLIVIALIVIVPLKVIHRWSSNTIVEHLSGDSATILTVGLVLSITTRGVEGLVENPYIRLLAKYAHEGVVVLVLVAIFLRAWKTLRIGKVFRLLWNAIRSMIP